MQGDPEFETAELMRCTSDQYPEYKNKRLFKEQLMNVAEALVIEHKNRHRLQKLNDLKFKIFGKDQFESKNNFIENNIESSMKFFSGSHSIEDPNMDAALIRSKLIKN